MLEACTPHAQGLLFDLRVRPIALDHLTGVFPLSLLSSISVVRYWVSFVVWMPSLISHGKHEEACGKVEDCISFIYPSGKSQAFSSLSEMPLMA